MSARHEHVSGDRILVHAHHAAGAPRSTALADVIQHVEDLLIGQARLLQDGPLSLGEVGLAGAAKDHPNAFTLAAPTTEVEISLPPRAPIWAVGVLAKEVLDGLHDDPP